MPITLTAKMIDPTSDRPKYLQVVDAIRVALDEGQLTANQSLPGEMEMAASLGVSRNTIRDALAELARDGLIITSAGKAAKVAPPVLMRWVNIARYAEEMALIRDGIPGDIEGSPFTRDHGIAWDDTDGDVVVTREPATANDARLLELTEGTDTVVRRAFVRHVNGKPNKVQRSAIPSDIADGTRLADGPFPFHGSILRELVAAGLDHHGEWRVSESVVPRMSFESEQRALQMPRQGIVLAFERVIYAGGRPVEASRAIVTGPSHGVTYEIAL